MKHISHLGSVVVAMLAAATASDVLAQTVCLTQRQKLLASDGAAVDLFGASVSISGDVVIVGAQSDDDNGSDSGSAYVYRHDDAAWTQEQKLLPSDGGGGELFGSSVSISGDVAIVAARSDDDNGEQSGSAYVYRHDGAAWTQEQKLLPSDGAASDNFGNSVSISGDVAIVGVRWDDDNGSDSGSAYVYRHDGAAWTQEQKLLPSDGAASDNFGNSVSISGDVATVGARLNDDNGDHSGSAYVYRYDGAAWAQEQKLLASDGAESHTFGNSVSISGDVVIVGAPSDDDNGANSGSAYVYRHDGAAWTQEQKLLPSGGAAGDLFGNSVSISGDVAIVAAYQDDDTGANSGSAYVYRHDGAAWTQEQKLLPSDGAVGDLFGNSASISRDVAIVGAFFNDDNGDHSGSAYVFDTGEPLADLDGDGAITMTDLLDLLAVWGPCPDCCPEDLDQSGAVDVDDMLILLANWG